MGFSFDFDKFKRQDMQDYNDFQEDDYAFEYADEFAFPDFSDDEDEYYD